MKDVYRLEGADYGRDFPYIAQVFSRREIDAWLADGPAAVVRQEFWQFFTGELWTFGERLCPPQAGRSG